MRRILIVDHPQITYGTFYLWHGLKELEARSNGALQVVCYPYIPTHYDKIKYDLRNLSWYWWISDLIKKSKNGGAPLPWGIPPFPAHEELTTAGAYEVDITIPRLFFPEQDIMYDEEQMVAEMTRKPFDLVILGNGNRIATILLARLREKIRRNFPPIVFFDSGERDTLNEHWVHVFHPIVTFKEHCTPEVERVGLTVKIPGYKFKVLPFPLSQPVANRPDLYSLKGTSIKKLQQISEAEEKEHQIFYPLGNTLPIRMDAVKVLDDLMDRKNLPKLPYCGYKEYHKYLAHSRMAFTMRGSGRDTLRYWEIPLYRTVMVADGSMGKVIPYPFTHGENALFYHSLDELERLVEHNLAGHTMMGDLDPIARAGQTHLRTYHSSLARGVFFLERMGEILPILDSDIQDTLRKTKLYLGQEDRPWRGPVTGCEGA